MAKEEKEVKKEKKEKKLSFKPNSDMQELLDRAAGTYKKKK